MNPNDAFTLGCIIFGALLIAKTLGSSFIARLPLSAAMLYLAAGAAIGPLGWGVLKLDVFKNTLLLERLAEVARCYFDVTCQPNEEFGRSRG